MKIENARAALVKPEGVPYCAYTEEMRELRQYVIAIDNWLVRWDAVIDGVQYCCKKIPPKGMVLPVDDWIRGERVNALREMMNMAMDGVQTTLEIV
jgi:hypothetical protein